MVQHLRLADQVIKENWDGSQTKQEKTDIGEAWFQRRRVGNSAEHSFIFGYLRDSRMKGIMTTAGNGLGDDEGFFYSSQRIEGLKTNLGFSHYDRSIKTDSVMAWFGLRAGREIRRSFLNIYLDMTQTKGYTSKCPLLKKGVSHMWYCWSKNIQINRRYGWIHMFNHCVQ